MDLSKLTSKQKFLIAFVVLTIVSQFICLIYFRMEFRSDSDLKSRQIQRLDSGINFDSKRQQFVLKARDIIVKAASEEQKMSIQQAYDIAEHDFYISEKYMLDPVFLLAMQRQESRFNVKAVSSENAKGLNQMSHTTAHIMADLRNIVFYDSILFDFRVNNELAATYLGYLKADFNNDMTKMLIAYNAGPNWVYKKELPKETKLYIPAIKKYYEDYKKELSFYLPGTINNSGK